ncbi:MAG: hypothetical protein JNL57_13290 [Bacteroidetes bacterium]|nr:hypothetical protein [Bacteroidota bacterium]
MKYWIILTLLFAGNGFAATDSMGTKSHLRPLIRKTDTLHKADTTKIKAMTKRMLAALQAQDPKPVYTPKAWYEYLNTRSWITIGIAVLMILGWLAKKIFW